MGYQEMLNHGHGRIYDSNPKASAGNVLDEPTNFDDFFQLIGLSLVSVLGSMGGIFIISAITVIDTFQVRGNVFLVSLTLSHLMVTILVIPTSCVAIMANIQDDPSICHFQWLITSSCLLISVLSFMFMSIENLKGITSLVTYDFCCTKLKIVTITLIIWLFGLSFPIGQHLNHFGPSICKEERNNPFIMPYHATICIVVIIFPTLVTIFCYLRCFFIVKYLKQQLESNPTEDPWAYMLTDENLLKSNMIVYLSSFLMWTPLVIVLIINSVYKPLAQELLNTCWYIGLSNSCIYSFIYAASNKDFAEAFFKLFYYCCCKSHVTWNRKGVGPRRSNADQVGLRVHIIPGLNMYAQRRDCSSTVSGRVGGGHNYNSYTGSSGHGFGPSGMMSHGGPFSRSFARSNRDHYKTSGDL